MRTFIAIDINQDIKDKISRIQDRLKYLNDKISLVKPENLHLTLKFLGELEEKEIAELKENLKDTLKSIKKFKIHLTGSGVFPSEKKIRVIWIGIKEGKRELARISKQIEPLFQEFNLDNKPFSPHLTIGRVKSIKDRKKLLTEVKKLESISLGFEQIDKIYLKKSILTPKQALYEDLAEFSLTA
jgi:2'-5' RNA ligase